MANDAVAAATEHFERTPVAPGCVRVLVQIGEQWHWTEMRVGDIWPAMVVFERTQIPSMRPTRYSDIGCAKAAILMLAAADRNDSYEVCVASLWLTLRRRREKANRHEAKMFLANGMSEFGGAWIVTISDDIADLASMDFYVVHPDWRPGHPDISIDLAPRKARPSIYDKALRSGGAYH